MWPDKLRIQSFGRWLARPVLLFYALPWLMILLTLGTLAQAELGLYRAHQLYFSSWIYWAGPLPLPGTYLTLTLITISLTAKFLMGSPWDRPKVGTTLTHLGVLVLLYGGLVTALTQREGFMVIEEGRQTNLVSAYHDRVLTIEKKDQPFSKIAFDALQEDTPVASLPFSLTPTLICRNCLPEPFAQSTDTRRRGMAEKVTLTQAPPEKEDELNLSGLMFEVSGTDDTDGVYAILEDVPMIPAFQRGEDTYTVTIGRRQTTLPFAIALEDFQKQDYPGTQTARAYHSDVTVKDGTLGWPVRIEMNTPLRYRGYTLYQSSFAYTPDGTEKTVLSVVQNKGWLFPYLASAIIFAGLCVHLFQRLGARRDG